jgi:hypothetical protein
MFDAVALAEAVDSGGYPTVVLIEAGATTTVYALTGESLDWSALDWRTRAFLRGFAGHVLARLDEVDHPVRTVTRP